MTAYYNDNDLELAEWLRALIRAGHLPKGEVDDRDIEEVSADDVKGFTHCHWFAGIGGWALALRLAGWPDDAPVWTASCPCQPVSRAGRKGAALDRRHVWPALFGLLLELHPAVVFGEQVAGPLGKEWASGIRADLECLGYACGLANLPAAGVGAPHIRSRLWWTAADLAGPRPPVRLHPRADRAEEAEHAWRALKRVHGAGAWPQWKDQSGAGVFVDGIPGRVGAIRGFGNAIVPQAGAAFIAATHDALTELAA